MHKAQVQIPVWKKIFAWQTWQQNKGLLQQKLIICKTQLPSELIQLHLTTYFCYTRRLGLVAYTQNNRGSTLGLEIYFLKMMISIFNRNGKLLTRKKPELHFQALKHSLSSWEQKQKIVPRAPIWTSGQVFCGCQPQEPGSHAGLKFFFSHDEKMARK